MIVHKKLMEPPILEAPAICILKIPKSTPIPWCPVSPDKGGYKVQPDPIPESTNLPIISRDRLGGKSQKDKLFKRGKDMSPHPKNKGSNQFPNPPIKIGITKKKIMINPWAVIITL